MILSLATQSFIPAAFADVMGVAVALVEDARGRKRNHVPAADTLDGPFDRTVGHRQFPDEGLIAALTVEYLTVDMGGGFCRNIILPD